MKKLFFSLLILFAALKLSSQITFVGFDQPFCGAPLSLTYTFTNVSTGGGSSSWNGYKIYRNGLEVYYNPGGSMTSSHSCIDLVFINDSTGFAIVGVGGMQTKITKTSDYGVSWTNIGTTAPGYLGLYVVSSNFAYLVTSPGSGSSNYLYVARCSDIDTPNGSWIVDDSTNSDVFKTDTVFGNSLCNIDSLNIFIQNGVGDTIDYHINLFYLPIPPVGINEVSNQNNKIRVYPNPSKNKITIECDNFYLADVFSMNGAKVLSSHSKEINLELLSIGVYSVRVIDTKGNSFSSKFIKE